jgi:hypothetical protein
MGVDRADESGLELGITSDWREARIIFLRRLKSDEKFGDPRLIRHSVGGL